MIHWTYIAYAIAAIIGCLALLGYFAAGMASRATTAEDYHFPNRCAGIAAVIIAFALLAGCAGGPRAAPEPIVRTIEVKVPVDDPACARALLEELGVSPNFPDTDEALAEARTIFEGAQLLRAGREQRIAYQEALIAGIEECAQ